MNDTSILILIISLIMGPLTMWWDYIHGNIDECELLLLRLVNMVFIWPFWIAFKLACVAERKIKDRLEQSKKVYQSLSKD